MASKKTQKKIGENKEFEISNLFATLFILLTAALLLSLPHILRYFNNDNVMPSDIAYYHARLAKSFMVGNVVNYDSLSFGGRPYFFDPYHPILGKTASFIGVETASKFLPFLFGVISALLFFLILRNLKLSVKHTFLSTMIFIFSPIYINTFVISSSQSFSIFLFLLGFFLYMQDSKMSNLFSLLIFLTMPLFGLAHSIASFLIVLLYSIKYKLSKRFEWVFIPALIFSLVYLIPLYTKFNFKTPIFIAKHYFSLFVAGMGMNPGISIFTFILFFISLFFTWQYKKNIWPAYILIITFFAATFFDFEFILYLNLILSVFAAVTLLNMAKAKWEIKLIKNLTLLILVCGIIFNTISFMSSLTIAKPNKETADALTWLATNSAENSVVLSHYNNGFWIEYFSNRPSYMDSSFQFYDLSDEKFNISRQIFQLRDIRQAKSLFIANHISYIYIDPDMKQGGIWTKPDEGILLLLHNNETFANVYNNSGYEIWKFIPGK